MNERLLQFLNAENLSQSQFADSIHVARASVSHIIAGRNKPGFDFIENMARTYPSLNIEWLITGKGKMYKNTSAEAPAAAVPQFTGDIFGPDPFQESSPAENNPEPQTAPAEQEVPFQAAPAAQSPREPETPAPQPKIAPAVQQNAPRLHQNSPAKARNITKIIVFYDDNTFQELK